MKKILLMLLILSMMLTATAFADDTGIQVIGGPSTESTPVSMDDMKIGKTVKIDGFGDVTIMSAEWCDKIDYRIENSSSWDRWYSKDEAEYLYIKLRILNTQKSAYDYAQEIHDIVCDFGDGYQFGGWYRQREDDTDSGYLYENEKTSYEIAPLYAGQYGVIVTLPNLVVESKEPLSVTFKIGDNEFTYHHRR